MIGFYRRRPASRLARLRALAPPPDDPNEGAVAPKEGAVATKDCAGVIPPLPPKETADMLLAGVAPKDTVAALLAAVPGVPPKEKPGAEA
jgi:hypothetical protein